MECVFVLLLLNVAASASEGSVQFWSNNVIMSCPFEIVNDWYNGDSASPLSSSEDNKNTMKVPYDEKNRFYYCTDEEEPQKKYYFYFKGHVCENCYELDGPLVIGMIVGDLLVTGGIIILIYHWAQRKATVAKPAVSGRPTPRQAPRGPTVPDRDYEPLSVATRETSTYAGLAR